MTDTLTGWDGKEWPLPKPGKHANFILDGKRKGVVIHRMKVNGTFNAAKIMRDFMDRSPLSGFTVDDNGVATGGGCTIRVEVTKQ